MNPTTVRSCYVRSAVAAVWIWVCIFLPGCGTTTQRMATEQLLISDAIDQAVSEIDFSYLADQDVFLDTQYLKGVKGSGFANADYIISSIRQELSAAGCRVHEESKDARIVIEPRVGALGTDGHEVTYGITQMGQITTAAAAFASSPVVPAIPEISFGRSDEQLGIAKIVLFAYERDSKIALWKSGIKKSESTSSNTWVLGAGPFQKGSIYEGFRFAGRKLKDSEDVSGDEQILAAYEDLQNESEETSEPVDRLAENTSEADDSTVDR